VRHKVYGKHLGRNKNERTALFRNLVQALLLEEKIETTESKAKAIKGLVDKVINQAKTPTTRRLVSQFVQNKKAYEKLVNDLVPRLGNRVSGYTSIVRVGKRLGDNAMIVQMSLLAEEKKAVESSRGKTEDKKEEKKTTKKEAEIKVKETAKKTEKREEKPKKGGKK
jgi:large subunit ribosomal protein L17